MTRLLDVDRVLSPGSPTVLGTTRTATGGAPRDSRPGGLLLPDQSPAQYLNRYEIFVKMARLVGSYRRVKKDASSIRSPCWYRSSYPRKNTVPVLTRYRQQDVVRYRLGIGVVLEDVAHQQSVGELIGRPRTVDLDVEHLLVRAGIVESAEDTGEFGPQAGDGERLPADTAAWCRAPRPPPGSSVSAARHFPEQHRCGAPWGSCC